jgi:adenosylcobinamide-GDP ribazoletransferase
MTTAIRHFLLALQFFTRIPVTGRLATWVGFSPTMLRASAVHFPGVGWIVGALSSAVFLGLSWALPPLPASTLVAAALSTVFSVLLTGAFHEDGLADLADGLGGSLDRERALDIMKDSRIGSYGALALVLCIASKLALLVMLAQHSVALAGAALFGAHVSSRLLPLWVLHRLPHVGDTAHSKSKPLADATGGWSLLQAGLWWLPAMTLLWVLLPAAPWWAALLGAVLGMACVWRLLQRRLGGFTGDGLGTAQQLSEVGFYLGLALGLGPGLHP